MMGVSVTAAMMMKLGGVFEMAGVNKAILVARLGQDPESKFLPNGNQVTNFTVATSESWVKGGQKEEKTTWHRIVAFGKLAEICSKYLHKGKEVYLEGKIDNRSYEQNGEKKYISEIVINQMQMLGSKNDSQGQNQHNQQKQNGYAPPTRQEAFPNEDPAGEREVPF